MPKGGKGTPLKQPKIGSLEVTKRCWSCFSSHVELLGEAQKLLSQKRTDFWGVILILSTSVSISSESILILAKSAKMRDCMVLARVVFETIVNILFICAEGEKAAKRAEDHYIQKVFRNKALEKEFRKRYLKEVYEFNFDLSKIPELKKNFDKYTGKKGQELSQWTHESVQKRINIISGKYGEKLAGYLELTMSSIYRDSSEIIHGTYYGALFGVGRLKLGGRMSIKEMQSHAQGFISLILCLLSLNIYSILKVLNIELSFPLLDKKSWRLIKDIEQFIKGDSGADQGNV